MSKFFTILFLKFEQTGYQRLCLKCSNRMANKVDPDQTVPFAHVVCQNIQRLSQSYQCLSTVSDHFTIDIKDTGQTAWISLHVYLRDPFSHGTTHLFKP